MRTLKTRKMKHRCSTPFCGGLNVTALTRAGSFAAAPPIYLCDACMKELLEAGKGTKRKKDDETSAQIEKKKEHEEE